MSSQIRFGFRKSLRADVVGVEGRHVEDRSRFRVDTMAKASTLGSIVTLRRTTCWILKRTLSLPFPRPPHSFSLCTRWGCNRRRATIVLVTFMGVAMRMKQDANSDTLTVSLETSSSNSYPSPPPWEIPAYIIKVLVSSRFNCMIIFRGSWRLSGLSRGSPQRSLIISNSVFTGEVS